MLIDSKILCALKLFAGVKDPRAYINSIYWDDDRMIATNGHMFAIAQVPERAEAPVIIPIEAFLLVKPNGGMVEITAERVGLLTYTPMDGRYPDWRRVVPTETSGETAQFNPDLITVLGKAGRLVDGFPRIAHNGQGCAIVRFGEQDGFFAGIMPINVEAGRVTRNLPPLERNAPTWAH